MKIALNILSRLKRTNTEIEDRFDIRLRAMTSAKANSPRLRRVSPPVLFGFRTRGMA